MQALVVDEQKRCFGAERHRVTAVIAWYKPTLGRLRS